MLAPPPSVAIGELPFATWTDAFTKKQLRDIIKISESLPMFESGVERSNSVNEEVRRSRNSWVSLTPETTFIYDTLGYVARHLNGQFFDFDIWGFSEDLQYTVYEESNGAGGFYDWHIDRGDSTATPRKLTLVLQLSDPESYEGGELEIMVGRNPTQVKKEKGLIAAFPSWVLHRVTPVTKGTRRSLVVWLTGPRFR
jgi:PKHD-type hydroxylase